MLSITRTGTDALPTAHRRLWLQGIRDACEPDERPAGRPRRLTSRCSARLSEAIGLQVGLILLFKERVLRGNLRLDGQWRGSGKAQKASENECSENKGPCLATHGDNVTIIAH
jgi:hypothetical protein